MQNSKTSKPMSLNDLEISSSLFGTDTKSKLFEKISKWAETYKKIEELKKENSKIQNEIINQLQEREKEYQQSIFEDPNFAFLCVIASAISKTNEKESNS